MTDVVEFMALIGAFALVCAMIAVHTWTENKRSEVRTLIWALFWAMVWMTLVVASAVWYLVHGVA